MAEHWVGTHAKGSLHFHWCGLPVDSDPGSATHWAVLKVERNSTFEVSESSVPSM